MKILIEFFSLRPIWTRRGLELIWYVYLLGTLIQLGLFVSFVYSAIGASNGGYHLSLVFDPVHAGASRPGADFPGTGAEIPHPPARGS